MSRTQGVHRGGGEGRKKPTSDESSESVRVSSGFPDSVEVDRAALLAGEVLVPVNQALCEQINAAAACDFVGGSNCAGDGVTALRLAG